MSTITKENFTQFNHISDEELAADIADILQENKDYSDEKDVLMRNPQQNRLRIYMLEGRLAANSTQLEQMQLLKTYRNTVIERL